MSTISPQEYRDLLSFFADESSAHNIISLALVQLNDTTAVDTNVSSYYSIDNTLNSTSGSETNDTILITPRISNEIPIWLIPCYGTIFFLAFIGNCLVILTLMKNRRMRTITNLYLLNLSISDMLLGLLCMPVTLTGTLLRHFIFGEFFCKLIQFSQAASVAVSSWTLVAISLERYYAICHPLRSRSWQTINHAYRIIAFIWCGSFCCMTPIAVFSQLMPTSRQGSRKCREQWPEDTIAYERFYNILLDLALLVLPLMILCVAYILITRTLYVGMKNERNMIFGGNSASHKVSTQVEAVATVTTTLMPSSGFNLNMSFRCHARNGAKRAEGEDVNGSASRCDSDTQNVTYHQQQQQHAPPQLQSQSQPQSQPPSQPQLQRQQKSQCYDDITQMADGKRKLLAAGDGRRQHLYCVRSASLRSMQPRGNNNDSGSSDGASPSASMTVINVPQQQRFNLQQQRQHQHQASQRRKSHSTPSLRIAEAALRRSNETKNLESKKRVVKMLFVLVLEFFICWTPLYVINTMAMFIGPAIYEYVDYTSISFFQLLAYSSSCCNPITYCFMNAGFRRAFVDTFKWLRLGGGRFWHKPAKAATNLSVAGNSISLANNATVMANSKALDSPRL